MGQNAYLLVETSIGRSLEVAGALRRQLWVQRVERLSGPYDVVAAVAGTSATDLEVKVKEALEDIDGIIRTAICPVFS